MVAAPLGGGAHYIDPAGSADEPAAVPAAIPVRLKLLRHRTKHR